MKIFIFPLALITSIAIKAQNTNNAVVSGNWNQCFVWNSPNTIYNTSDDYKVIHPGVTVTQNLGNVFAKKITLLGSGKITLSSNNKISFSGNGNPIVSSPACSSSYLDNVFVNFNEPVAAKSLSGFLHSLGYGDINGTLVEPPASQDSQPNTEILQLQPKLFRIADFSKYHRAYALSGRVQIVLSDRWGYPLGHPANTPPIPNPSVNSNWCEYKDYLNGLFDEAENGGNTRPGIVWECWNEPNLPDNGFAHRQDFFETYAAFYHTIKASPLAVVGSPPVEDPTLLVAGPSISRFDKDYLHDFFEFCLRRNLQVNDVTWHELLNDPNDRPSVKLKEHVEYIRNNYINNSKYASLNIKTITVNEIVPREERGNPVIVATHLGYLEQAGVDYACKSCWQDNPTDVGSCFDKRLNNLYIRSAFPDNHKTAVWHTYKLYVDGVSSRVKSYNESANSVIIASSSNAQSRKQILFGYSDNLHEEETATVPTGTYKFRLNNVGPASSTRTIAIKEISYAGINATDNGANVAFDNLPSTNFYSTTVTLDSYGGYTIDISNIKKENLYQMTIY